MTKVELRHEPDMVCKKCSHHQNEKSVTITQGSDSTTFSLNNLGAGVCTNSESDHFGHITMNYHLSCEEAYLR